MNIHNGRRLSRLLTTSPKPNDLGEVPGTEMRLFAVGRDPDQVQGRRKLLHDFANTQITIKGCIEALRRGYRFDDETAEARMRQLEASLDVLRRAYQELEELFR